MVVAIPILLLGLSMSHLDVIQGVDGMVQMEGNSILYLAAKFLTFGKLLPAPLTLGARRPLRYWIRYFFTGRPIPLGATDVFIHPVAFAGWAGLLVTALNLIPAGTLDGGHVVYALFGDKSPPGVSRSSWWCFSAWDCSGMDGGSGLCLLLWLGRVHAEPLDQITPLDRPRLAVAVLMILIFLLTFSPVPFSIFAAP